MMNNDAVNPRHLNQPTSTPTRTGGPHVSESHGAGRRFTPRLASGISLAAIAGLTLSACGPDDALDTSGDGEPNSTVTLGADEEEADQDADQEETGGNDETDDDPTEEDTQDGNEEDSSAEEETDQDADGDAGGDGDDTSGADGAQDHPLYGGLETVQAEYPEGVVFEVEADDDNYEWHIYVDGIEREVYTDKSSLEIVHTEDDDAPDSDDQREIDAIEVDFAEAFQAAEEHAGDTAGAFIDEAELDTEDGVVVWEIELDNDRDIYVDVTSAEVVHVDD